MGDHALARGAAFAERGAASGGAARQSGSARRCWSPPSRCRSRPSPTRRRSTSAVLVLTYVMLGWGLNIVVGLAGLLDLGYVAFYAVGAYTYALLSTQFGLSFWMVLPLAGHDGGELRPAAGLSRAAPARRLPRHRHPGLRRDHPHRLHELGRSPTGRTASTAFPARPCSARSSPRPRRRGRRPSPTSSASPYLPIQRVIFLYFVILLFALGTNLFTLRIRKLPISRAWEALREDETACRALGINPAQHQADGLCHRRDVRGHGRLLLRRRQGFISPESFVFLESAVILAIVVLGGLGHPDRRRAGRGPADRHAGILPRSGLSHARVRHRHGADHDLAAGRAISPTGARPSSSSGKAKP